MENKKPKTVKTEKPDAYDKLVITLNVLDLMIFLFDNGRNKFYQLPDFPDWVFMSYYQKGSCYYTVIDQQVYLEIKDSKWYGCGGYIRMTQKNEEGKRIYLSNMICRYIRTGLQAHHESNRFDNRVKMLYAVTSKTHDRHRAYPNKVFELSPKTLKYFEEIMGINRNEFT